MKILTIHASISKLNTKVDLNNEEYLLNRLPMLTVNCFPLRWFLFNYPFIILVTTSICIKLYVGLEF